MGSTQSFAQLFRPLWSGTQETRILVLPASVPSPSTIRVQFLGLDSAGKTTMLCKLGLGTLCADIPVINLETLTYKNITFTTWDLGGRDPLRHLWRRYYPRTNAIIFMVDSNNRERIDDSEHELRYLLRQEELRGVPLLVLANKMDLPNAMEKEEVIEKLNLKSVYDRDWHAQMCCAVASEGFMEGFEWLQQKLSGGFNLAPPLQPHIGISKA